MTLDFLDRHAAFLAGYELGKSERVEIEIEDQVQTRLQDQARPYLRIAEQYAADKGPAWSQLVTGEPE